MKDVSFFRCAPTLFIVCFQSDKTRGSHKAFEVKGFAFTLSSEEADRCNFSAYCLLSKPSASNPTTNPLDDELR